MIDEDEDIYHDSKVSVSTEEEDNIVDEKKYDDPASNGENNNLTSNNIGDDNNNNNKNTEFSDSIDNGNTILSPQKNSPLVINAVTPSPPHTPPPSKPHRTRKTTWKMAAYEEEKRKRKQDLSKDNCSLFTPDSSCSSDIYDIRNVST